MEGLFTKCTCISSLSEHVSTFVVLTVIQTGGGHYFNRAHQGQSLVFCQLQTIRLRHSGFRRFSEREHNEEGQFCLSLWSTLVFIRMLARARVLEYVCASVCERMLAVW